MDHYNQAFYWAVALNKQKIWIVWLYCLFSPLVRFSSLLLSKPEAAHKALSDNSLLKNIEFNEKFLGEENITEGRSIFFKSFISFSGCPETSQRQFCLKTNIYYFPQRSTCRSGLMRLTSSMETWARSWCHYWEAQGPWRMLNSLRCCCLLADKTCSQRGAHKKYIV